MGLEEIALADDYFIERKLYPNVDFYTGLIYKSMGFPTRMFTVLFALGRLPGLDRPVARDDRGPHDEDRPPAPGLHRRGRARLRAGRRPLSRRRESRTRRRRGAPAACSLLSTAVAFAAAPTSGWAPVVWSVAPASVGVRARPAGCDVTGGGAGSAGAGVDGGLVGSAGPAGASWPVGPSSSAALSLACWSSFACSCLERGLCPMGGLDVGMRHRGDEQGRDPGGAGPGEVPEERLGQPVVARRRAGCRRADPSATG